VFEHRGRNTELVDLEGRALLPGFVDAHGHVAGIGPRGPGPLEPCRDLDQCHRRHRHPGGAFTTDSVR
jgi:predicted amidohydrolase YtcJ